MKDITKKTKSYRKIQNNNKSGNWVEVKKTHRKTPAISLQDVSGHIHQYQPPSEVTIKVHTNEIKALFTFKMNYFLKVAFL